MGVFSSFKKKREQKRKLKELKQFSSMFSTLDRLEACGQLTFDPMQQRLFITQSLAVLMMRNAQSWVNFVTNVYLWIYFKRSLDAWDKYIIGEELAAVRAAAGSPPEPEKKEDESVPHVAVPQQQNQQVDPSRRPPLAHSDPEVKKPLSRADAERIRRARRAEIAEGDIEPPKVEPFDMFIVEDTTDRKPSIIAVGYFDPATGDTELAPWEEVSAMLNRQQDQSQS